MDLTGVDARLTLFPCFVDLTGLELDSTAYKGVVSVAVSTLVAASQLDMAQVSASREHKVKLVPMLRPGMSPRHPVLGLGAEEGDVTQRS